jgi:hypothetical protein
VLAIALFAWALVAQDGDAPKAGPSSSPTQQESRSESPSKSPSPTEEQGPTEEEMQSFIEDYLATAPSDPKTTWQRLTPGFQQQSGGYGAYERWWTQFESATPGDISADPDRLIVSYGVNYVRKDGSTQSDSVTLQLEQDGDSLLIAGES